MLQDQVILEYLQYGEEHLAHNIFSSVAVIHSFATKCKNREVRRFVVGALLDAVRTGNLEKHVVSTRSLASTDQKHGFIEFYEMKYKVMNLLQNDVADQMGVPNEVKRELVDKAGSWRLFREHVEPYDGSVVALQWKRGWAKSSELYFMLYLQVCFKKDYDGAVKQGLKNRKSAAEILQYGHYKEAFDAVEKASKEERDKFDQQKEKAKKEAEAELDGGEGKSDGKSVTGKSEGQATATDATTGGLPQPQPQTNKWRNHAERIVDTHVQLLPELATETEMSKSIQGHPMSKVPTTPGSGRMQGDNVAIMFTSSLSSESQTAPHIRSAPFRAERLAKLGNAIITARRAAKESDDDGLAPGEFLITLDGQKPGNNVKFTKFLKRFGRKLIKKAFTVMYDYDTKLARKDRVKGIATVCLQERMQVIAMDSHRLQGKPWLSLPGNTAGDIIGPLKLDRYSDQWLLSFADKRELYGKMRLPVGGSLEEEEFEDDEDDKVDDDSIPPYFMDDGIRGSALSRKDDHMEPVTYGSLPVEFFLNVLDGLSIRDVVDITPADGNLALACIIKQRGYVGIGFTEFHCTALRSHLVDVVLECFGKDGHPLFHANYKQQIEDETEARGEKRKREEEPKKPPKEPKEGKEPKEPKKPPKKNKEPKKRKDEETSSDEETSTATDGSGESM